MDEYEFKQLWPLKAITISQPFPTLIADQEKWIENRTWTTYHRGLVAIHAGKASVFLKPAELVKYKRSCVLAVADLTACVSIDTIRKNADENTRIPGSTRTWREAFEHEHAQGPFCWVLENIRKLDEPFHIRGAQGLWQIG